MARRQARRFIIFPVNSKHRTRLPDVDPAFGIYPTNERMDWFRWFQTVPSKSSRYCEGKADYSDHKLLRLHTAGEQTRTEQHTQYVLKYATIYESRYSPDPRSSGTLIVTVERSGGHCIMSARTKEELHRRNPFQAPMRIDLRWRMNIL